MLLFVAETDSELLTVGVCLLAHVLISDSRSFPEIGSEQHICVSSTLRHCLLQAPSSGVLQCYEVREKRKNKQPWRKSQKDHGVLEGDCRNYTKVE
jgi:hypothetical protein